MAVGPVGEREAAGEAAGGLDAQPLGTSLQAPFDVTEVVFQGTGGSFQLPHQLLETELVLPQPLDDPLAEGRRLLVHLIP